MRRLPLKTARRIRPDQLAEIRSNLAAFVTLHVRRYIGPIKAVLEGTESGGMRADMLWVDPGRDRPFHTLVTCGMGLRPMSVAESRCACSPFAELVLRLPPDWPIGPTASRTSKARWPIEELFHLAYMPHREQTHVGHGHTVTVIDPKAREVAPICVDSPFHGWVLRRPDWTPRSFRSLRLTFEQRLDFLSAVALFADELELAYDKGSGVLLEHLDRAGVTDLLATGRPSALSPIH